VFKERGFDQGNLDDDVASLGTGRASLYHFVPSKAHLLYLIFDRAISTTLDTRICEGARASTTSAEVRTR
jgi:AcrR family transcriptional regulator